MKLSIPFYLIPTSVLAILLFAMCYHIAALLHFIPLDMVWGGRLQSREELIQMETFSFFFNALLVLLVIWRSKWFPALHQPKILTMVCWLISILFMLNTLGNLFAANILESILFTPITILLAYGFMRLARLQ